LSLSPARFFSQLNEKLRHFPVDDIELTLGHGPIAPAPFFAQFSYCRAILLCYHKLFVSTYIENI
jgi:hypothetical protein